MTKLIATDRSTTCATVATRRELIRNPVPIPDSSQLTVSIRTTPERSLLNNALKAGAGGADEDVGVRGSLGAGAVTVTVCPRGDGFVPTPAVVDVHAVAAQAAKSHASRILRAIVGPSPEPPI
jgi:hypothetical protein